jgi:hypothetical protein
MLFDRMSFFNNNWPDWTSLNDSEDGRRVCNELAEMISQNIPMITGWSLDAKQGEAQREDSPDTIIRSWIAALSYLESKYWAWLSAENRQQAKKSTKVLTDWWMKRHSRMFDERMLWLIRSPQDTMELQRHCGVGGVPDCVSEWLSPTGRSAIRWHEGRCTLCMFEERTSAERKELLALFRNWREGSSDPKSQVIASLLSIWLVRDYPGDFPDAANLLHSIPLEICRSQIEHGALGSIPQLGAFPVSEYPFPAVQDLLIDAMKRYVSELEAARQQGVRGLVWLAESLKKSNPVQSRQFRDKALWQLGNRDMGGFAGEDERKAFRDQLTALPEPPTDHWLDPDRTKNIVRMRLGRDAWEKVDELWSVKQNCGSGRICAAEVDAAMLYLLVQQSRLVPGPEKDGQSAVSENRTFTYGMWSVDLLTGDGREICSLTAPRCDVTQVSIGNVYVSVATTAGLMLFPRSVEGKARFIGVEQGLPCSNVTAAAEAGGVLYLACSTPKEGMLVSVEPGKSGYRTIAASARIQKDSDLDECPPYEIRDLVHQEEKNRLVFAANGFSGIWSYSLSGQKLQRGRWIAGMSPGRLRPTPDGRWMVVQDRQYTPDRGQRGIYLLDSDVTGKPYRLPIDISYKCIIDRIPALMEFSKNIKLVMTSRGNDRYAEDPLPSYMKSGECWGEYRKAGSDRTVFCEWPPLDGQIPFAVSSHGGQVVAVLEKRVYLIKPAREEVPVAEN